MAARGVRLRVNRGQAPEAELARRDFLKGAVWVCSALLGACSSSVTGASRRGDREGPDAGSGGTGSRAGGESGGASSKRGAAAADASATCSSSAFATECEDAIPAGGDFILDTQTHWFNRADVANFAAYQQAFGSIFAVATEEKYIQDLFCDSDTTVACLSGSPGVLCTDIRPVGCGSPLANDSIVRTRDKINQLAGNTQRVLSHVVVMPQDPSGIDAQLALMEQFHCHGVAGWQLFPGYKPGFRLDGADDLAKRVIEKGLELGVKLFVVHKGLPSGNFFDPDVNYPDDIGPVAALYPDANFIIDTSAICAGMASCMGSVEGPYDPSEEKPLGVNALIRTVEEHSLRGKNVYAGLGGAFSRVMADPGQGAHLIGKLLKYLGEDNVLWGTGAITGGGLVQPQIEAFRALVIAEEARAQHGYPELTPTLKAKVFGLSAARVYGVDPAAPRCRLSTCT